MSKPKVDKALSNQPWWAGDHIAWPCGCIRFQDGFELCPKHKVGGWRSLAMGEGN